MVSPEIEDFCATLQQTSPKKVYTRDAFGLPLLALSCTKAQF